VVDTGETGLLFVGALPGGGTEATVSSTLGEGGAGSSGASGAALVSDMEGAITTTQGY